MLKDEVVEFLLEKISTSDNIEKIASIRNKPYIKLQKDESYTFHVSQRTNCFPHFSSLLNRGEDIIKTNYDLLSMYELNPHDLRNKSF